ncbi:hypothetical protein HYH03_006466 [Edaphochlamys debaryana]|uniref:Uncharacterized protein n=1 Tax=Edaphochlamys debaryana TaxID=47281 RepID=A0A836C1E4_9CHLO|nr:hypothetical protein HYH03_006466 [Edaphochlamys debaryana]|eukprot:KAG2495523.1 hypothetical protein HYH03_006466 [Edaphochlamys debaryana]
MSECGMALTPVLRPLQPIALCLICLALACGVSGPYALAHEQYSTPAVLATNAKEASNAQPSAAPSAAAPAPADGSFPAAAASPPSIPTPAPTFLPFTTVS